MGHLNDRQFSSFVKDGKNASNNSINTPYAQVGAGLFTSSTPSLSDGQFSFLRLDNEGYLLTKLKTTIDLSGDLNVDVSAFTDKSGTDIDGAMAYQDGDDVSAVTPLFQAIAGYDSVADMIRAITVDGQSRPVVTVSYSTQTLADVTDGTDGTYTYSWQMEDSLYFSLQAVLNGGSGTATLTVEASNDNTNWIDVTDSWFGITSTTSSDILERDTPAPLKYIRAKIVASTGGANDADWKLELHKKR